MKRLGFTQSNNDPCLYSRRNEGGLLYVTIFVDDLVIAGDSEMGINMFKNELRTKYNMKDLGELSYSLGMEITRSADGKEIKLTQCKYAHDVLERFGMSECKGSSIPMDPGLQLPRRLPSDSAKLDYDYRAVVGSLMYLMVTSRPDLSYSVTYLARYLNCYDRVHTAAAQQVLQYLKATQEYGLTYRHRGNETIVGYSDSDYGSCVETRRSTTGYVFFLSGGAISWKSKLQPTVALSSTEAEYMALSATAQEAMALRYLSEDFGIATDMPTLIYEDNKGAIAMSQNPTSYAKTKHIHIRYHYTRELLRQQYITVAYRATGEMIADTLTKPLSRDMFRTFCNQLLGSSVICK
jgi:hypothetical protein